MAKKKSNSFSPSLNDDQKTVLRAYKEYPLDDMKSLCMLNFINKTNLPFNRLDTAIQHLVNDDYLRKMNGLPGVFLMPTDRAIRWLSNNG